jgi:NAD(P)-dependent dehydrogenase (short-subunit alcohol dehydrogenase family)
MSETVLITGANRGIGLEFVRFYAARGAHVYACCRQPEMARELTALAAASDGRIQVQPLDVTNARHIANLKAVLGDTPIDILINNAGIYGQDDASFGNTDVEAWLQTFRVNTIAPVKIAEALVDNVSRSQRRVMAFLSSKMGSIEDNGSGGSYVYRTSKTALNMAVKSLAIDLAPRGIAVAALHPGWVLTEMGGPNAEIDTATSVKGMARVLDALTPDGSGLFYEYDGGVIPW